MSTAITVSLTLRSIDVIRRLNSAGYGVEPELTLTLDAGELVDRRIVTGEHCFGCTAGSGSSCGGAIV